MYYHKGCTHHRVPQAQRTAEALWNALDSATAMMADRTVPGEEPLQMTTDRLKVTIHKDIGQNVTGQLLGDSKASVDLPPICELLSEPDCPQGNQPVAVRVRLLT